MRLLLLISFFIAGHTLAKAQKVDSIYFNLYTDSLKKGVHNYINVDGKLSNGNWLPLTAKEITFTSTAGTFDGNSLLIDSSFKGEKVIIKAVLKSDPKIWREIAIFIKTKESIEKLKTEEEIFRDLRKKPVKKTG